MLEPRAAETKRGRPSRGDRKPTMVSLPGDFHDAVIAIAQREGLPVTDIVTRFVAHNLDRPVPLECLPRAPRTQTQLPLPRRAPRRRQSPPASPRRRPTMVRLPRDFHDAVAVIAVRERLPLTAVVTRFVARSLNKPVPESCMPRTPDTQQELPLTKAS